MQINILEGRRSGVSNAPCPLGRRWRQGRRRRWGLRLDLYWRGWGFGCWGIWGHQLTEREKIGVRVNVIHKKTRKQKGLGKDLMTIITHYFLPNTYSWSSFRSVKLITQCFRSNISSVWVLRNYNLNEDQVGEVNSCKQTGNSIQLRLRRSSFLKSLNRIAIENVS